MLPPMSVLFILSVCRGEQQVFLSLFLQLPGAKACKEQPGNGVVVMLRLCHYVLILLGLWAPSVTCQILTLRWLPTFPLSYYCLCLEAHTIGLNTIITDNLQILDFLIFCWPCITVYQYSETNVMHFLFSLLRVKGLYMFRALLGHPQNTLHKRHFVYCVRVMSVGCTRIGIFHTNPGLANWHNTHAIYQVSFVQHLLKMSR
jgi:hypothetical protein